MSIVLLPLQLLEQLEPSDDSRAVPNFRKFIYLSFKILLTSLRLCCVRLVKDMHQLFLKRNEVNTQVRLHLVKVLASDTSNDKLNQQSALN